MTEELHIHDYREQKIDAWVRRKDKWLLIQDVPVRFCRDCHDRSYADDVAERVNAIRDGSLPLDLKFMMAYICDFNATPEVTTPTVD